MEASTLTISMVAPMGPNVVKRGLRKSPTSWKLANLHEDDAVSVTDSEEGEDDVNSPPNSRKRSSSVWMHKPPRHRNMPSCVHAVLKLWERELQRKDISVLSDFFYDLEGTDQQGIVLVDQMRSLGVNISVHQFFSMPRCSIYSIFQEAV
ncbi:hypothetical protein Poli38472_001638 [Pythium oligandrum]|uniref:Uncharacterized protein n=1 Tax=Pythium oligandrum TaxID=41045 RepID=A0A8K1FRY7_PYTOL|nr:hypothetical protein Poli38472_001638 [Pythium oligandrum]|eukprot:TMW69482.1 hypothetical protein Poli38472_001638 [Pythium oligandrum]